ncbi:hypothetical protein ABW21_db0207127 [Orbilia brochopaga]|nr:hypothetical protein ABW21_db0207127 [Drechslerella brochopaga]
MSMNLLPYEILIQILDDHELEYHDLAALAGVSRRCYDMVIPSLYRVYTFRYMPILETAEERKLQSFMKHCHHVKYDPSPEVVSPRSPKKQFEPAS